MRDRTLFVRYEDMTLNPLATAEKIYKFLGLEFDYQTKENFLTATQTRNRKRRSSNIIKKFKIVPQKPKYHNVDMFGASKSKRNQFWENWR